MEQQRPFLQRRGAQYLTTLLPQKPCAERHHGQRRQQPGSVWLCLLRITTQCDADQIDSSFNADQPRRVD
ncbi:hypothetical protein MTO96_011887 [Rhipicephalus appendiculatus]